MSCSSVGLYNPKIELNVGGALRAAYNFQADMVAISGRRYKHQCTDTVKAYRHIPVLHTDDIIKLIPYQSTPVAVEICDKAKPIYNFVHPKSAFYIFGPEDGSLGKSILDKCPYVVYIPTKQCMNLAATVNVVLYDRLLKENK